MSKRGFRTALIVVLASLVVLGVAAFLIVSEIYKYPNRPHQSATKGAVKMVTVKVAKGTRFQDLAAELAQDGLVERPTWFRWYATQRGLATKVRAGTYELADNLTPRELLDILVKGVEEVDVAVTIPEGKNLNEVVAIIDQAGIAPAAELTALARDPAWLKTQGIDGETVNGYLFPETYRFKKPTPAKAVLEMLVRHHVTVFSELRTKHQKGVEELCQKLGWGASCDHDLVTMASIVEKETGDAAERPRVASVFYNRMTMSSFASHRLETDPTIRYGCTIPAHKSAACAAWDQSGRLHKAQLEDADNPYNTYQHAGLPPGPISNPGRASLEAAMAPENTSYLYFVAEAKDVHSHFSKTFEEHTKWVQKYVKDTKEK